MKKLNRILFSILFASLAVPFASCGDDEEEDDTPKASHKRETKWKKSLFKVGLVRGFFPRFS